MLTFGLNNDVLTPSGQVIADHFLKFWSNSKEVQLLLAELDLVKPLRRDTIRVRRCLVTICMQIQRAMPLPGIPVSGKRRQLALAMSHCSALVYPAHWARMLQCP